MDTANDLTDLEPSPSAYSHYRDYLHAVYAQRKQRSKGYSYGRFAADLGLQTASIIHQIIRGRRKLTSKAAQKLAQHLSLKSVERTYFLKLVDHCNATAPRTREQALRELVDLKARIALQAPSRVTEPELA
jgi:uncharacterized protein (TIGR02147 family)